MQQKIPDERSGEFFHERVERGAVGVEKIFGPRKRVGAAALEHVAGERPGRAAETKQRGAAGEFFFEQGERIGDVGEIFRHGGGGREAVDVGARGEREVHGDAAFVAEVVALAERFSGTTRTVGKRIAASKAKRRIGWRVGTRRRRAPACAPS